MDTQVVVVVAALALPKAATRRARGTGIRRTASDKTPTTMTAAQRRAMRLRARRGR